MVWQLSSRDRCDQQDSTGGGAEAISHSPDDELLLGDGFLLIDFTDECPPVILWVRFALEG